MTTIESISQLNKIFKTKKWSEKDVDEFAFDNFCKLLDNINETQRRLIIELVERYQWISFTEYQEKILSTLEKVEDKKIEKLKNIYFFPIIKPEDEGLYKSGPTLIYPIKAFKNHLTKYKNVTFKYISKFENLTDPSFKLQDNEAIFLIDDYVGSGETLNTCLDLIKTNKTIKNDKINVLTLAIQKETANNIIQQGITSYSEYYSSRGITDFNESPLLEEKVKIMLEIEKMIPGGNNFSFGYKESEALITLARTPDNTFPIFWMKHRIGKVKFEAPFSRDETIEL
jgi:hypothetical protein